MAVVSQPNDRDGKVGAPGKLDASLGEFWVERPWEIFKKGHNLSSYERKRFFLNVPGSIRGRDFLDLSFLSGADNDGDGRSVVAADFRNTGQLDLVVRQAGGGPIILYENQFPPRHYLKVSLRGTKSNRLGIGANHFNAEFFQSAAAEKGHRCVQSSLAAKRRKQHKFPFRANPLHLVTFARDDFLHALRRDRLDIRPVRELRVGHDGRRI